MDGSLDKAMLYNEYFQQQNSLHGHFHQCITDIYILSDVVAEVLHFENHLVLTHHLAFMVTKPGYADTLFVIVDDRLRWKLDDRH